MEQENPKKKQLVRDVKREALRRMEDAARSENDFKNVIKQWDHLDDNEQHRVNDHEIGRPDAVMLHWDREDADDRKGFMKGWLDTVIPPPLEHAWWRQLLSGDFLDFIHDCPFEMHELTTSRVVSELLKTLNENQIEVLYYRAIRQNSFQQIAAMRGQTDRNILKVYAVLIEGLRKKLHDRLTPRYDAKLPLTVAQKQFMTDYRAGRPKTGKPKISKGKKKTALDGQGGE